MLIVTISGSDLRAPGPVMTKERSEAPLLDDLCKVDLLVLDEVGIQRDSAARKFC